VQGIIAGGETALRNAVEGAEDDFEAGGADLRARGLSELDVVVGISANGGAPYVQGAFAEAIAVGARTALITCNPLRPDMSPVDHPIILPVGPELLAGSTRLKAGTATKLALNMISTLSMVQLGKVHDNLMVDVRVSNAKLKARARRLVERLTGLEADAAEALLARAGGRVKRAVVMHHMNVEPSRAEALLVESGGFLRPWVNKAEPAG
jgi:N-acetylmuramic acid 6-phosphate etherase